MSDIILATKKLCKTFSNEGTQQHVLKNLDVEIKRGDFTVIMGSSGAGKSTLMYALSGMDQPSMGEIYFDGVKINGMSEDQLAVFRRKHCGFVFQQVYLLNQMSLLDNIISTGLLVNKNKKQIEKRAKELFDQVNLSVDMIHKFPTQISGGEAQRAGIVRALINEPSIVFADEPTGALNSGNSESVLNTLSAVNEKGQSIVMVTHDLKSARRGNRIIYLRDGVICGECQLGQYVTGDAARHAKLKAFLTEMGW